MTTGAKIREPNAGMLDMRARQRADRLLVWRNCLLKAWFHTPNAEFSATTNAVSVVPAGVLESIKAQLSGETYSLVVYMPLAFIHAVHAASGSLADLDNMDEPDAILVLEQTFADPLEQIARLTGEYLQITTLEPVSTIPVGDRDFQFTILDSQGRQHLCAVEIDGDLEARIIERIVPFSSASEKTVANALDVRIGPILISRDDLARVREGHIIDCGVQPSDIIRGLLVRSDNQAWPCHIEDAGVHITGACRPLDFSSARKADASLVTLSFAGASLGPLDRLQLSEGSFVDLGRHEQNRVDIFANDQLVGIGHLVVEDGNLGVKVDQTGLGE